MANKGGRPKLPDIDWNEFENLCKIQCTVPEISSYFDMSDDTLQRKVLEHYGVGFAVVFAQKKGKGKVSLRRRQIQAALAGDKTMMVWLGKNYLDQTDKQEIKQEIKSADGSAVKDILSIVERGIKALGEKG